MNEDYYIKKITSKDFDLLIPLMRDCFGMNVDIKYFRWKYTENPAGEFIGFVAVKKESEEIGAYYGVIPELYSVNGEEKIIYQSCDTMTHSAHRRKGLFQMLSLYCYDFLRQSNLLFVYGYGGASSTPGFLKFGWRKVFEPTLIFFPRQFLFFTFLHKIKNHSSYVDDIGAIESLLLKSNVHTAIHALKKIENYKWRIKNPLREYKVLAIKENDSFQAFAIFYKENRKLFLFDWFGVNKKYESRILKCVIKELKNDRLLKGVITLIKPNGKYYKGLKRNLFIINPFKSGPLKSDTTFITFSSEKDTPFFSQSSNWDPVLYDHDAY